MCITLPCFLDIYYFPENGAGDLSESADILSSRIEYKIICGTGGNRGFQYVPFIPEQLYNLAWGNGDRGPACRSGILFDCQIPVQGQKRNAALFSGDADAARIGAADADVYHVQKHAFV